MCSNRHAHTACSAFIGDSADTDMKMKNELSLRSLRTIRTRSKKSFDQNIFCIEDKDVFTRAHIEVKICDEESGRRIIKNEFSALKNNFFLDKKKLI